MIENGGSSRMNIASTPSPRSQLQLLPVRVNCLT
jgi:hypothetical protein